MQPQSEQNTNENQQTPSQEDIENLERQIGAMKERAKQSQSEARESFNKQIQAAEDQLSLLRARWNKLAHQAGEATQEFRQGVSKAWDDLKSSVEKASEHLK